MTYIPDFAFCNYTLAPYGPVLAIGWLDGDYDYPKGPVPTVFLKKLNSLIQNTEYHLNGMRGIHENNLPQAYPDQEVAYFDAIPELPKNYPLANGELHIKYQDHYYASPVMILQYIIQYAYSPPQQYIEAVLNGQVVNVEYFIEQASIYESINATQDAYPQKEVSAIQKKCEKYLVEENLEKALEVILHGLVHYPESSSLLFYKARLESEDISKNYGIPTIDKVLKAEPNNYLLYGMKGIAYFHQGDASHAQKYLNLVLPTFKTKGGRNLVQFLFYLGKLAEAKNNFVEAEAHFKEALSIDKDDHEIEMAYLKNKARNKLSFLPNFVKKWI